MTSRKAVAASLLVLLASIAGAANPPVLEAPGYPALADKDTANLLQLDVTLSGDPATLSTLTSSDFEIWVGKRQIEEVRLDAPGIVAAAQGQRESGRALPASSPAAAYVFYFDQRHLTPAGRERSLSEAAELIPRLVVGGSRGMVVSNGARLSTFARWTTDAQALLRAVEKIRSDPEQRDPTAGFEETRVAELEREIAAARQLRAASDGSAGAKPSSTPSDPPATASAASPGSVHGVGGQPQRDPVDAWLKRAGVTLSERVAEAAGKYEEDERWQAEVDLQRLASILGFLVDAEAPRAVLYFADTMRHNAGEHYLRLLADALSGPDGDPPGGMGQVPSRGRASGAEIRFAEVIRDASADRIRFYPIRAEAPVPSTPRMQDARDTLVALGRETGGRPYVDGTPASKIADGILDDLSRLCRMRFDPTGLPVDEPLPLRVRALRPGVKARAPATITARSEKARATARLLASLAVPETMRNGIPIRANLIPTGYQDGAFTALVQVAVPGSSLLDATWDVGASLVSRGTLRADASARIRTSTPGAPFVLEREMKFAPGPYEIVAVARESAGDRTAAATADGSWPDPEAMAATVGPIAVLQPSAGAFVRNEDVHARGSLVRDDSDPLRVGLATAVIGLVCQRPGEKEALRVERKLTGEGLVEFPPIELQPSEDPCSQVRDMIPAGTMGAGTFRYEIRVLEGGEEVARGERTFVAIGRD